MKKGLFKTAVLILIFALVCVPACSGCQSAPKAAVPDSTAGKVAVTHDWAAGSPAVMSARKLRVEEDRSGRPGFIPIEDFDTASVTALSRFGRRLFQGEPVRIAFLGDSFIEGDILTSDLRRMLQNDAGGPGAKPHLPQSHGEGH